MVSQVRGVLDVHSTVTVVIPDTKQQRDSRLAQPLQRRLNDLYRDVRVAVYGGVAVLSGEVETLASRRGAETLAADHQSISRVVNKLLVAARELED